MVAETKASLGLISNLLINLFAVFITSLLFITVLLEYGFLLNFNAIIFSAKFKPMFKPLKFLSSGIWDNPDALTFRGDLFVIFLLSKYTLPLSIFLSPHIASTN